MLGLFSVFYIHITIGSGMLRFFAHKILFMFNYFSFCEPLKSFKDSCHIFVTFLLLFEYAKNYAIKSYEIQFIFKILDIFILFVMNIQDCTSRVPLMYSRKPKNWRIFLACAPAFFSFKRATAMSCLTDLLLRISQAIFPLWCGFVADSTVIFLV
jgi:hypothetical protein